MSLAVHRYVRSGIEASLLGGACATVAYVVGRAVNGFATDVLYVEV